MFKKKNKLYRKSIDQMPINTVISEKITVKGDINGDSSIRIDGTVEGNLSVSSGIILGEKAKVIGNIESASVIVYGNLKGNLKAKELTIKSSAIIEGDISTELLEIEPGGKYNGTLLMENLNQKLPKEEKTRS